MADKFEREIDEILNKLDKFPARPRRLRVRNGVTRRVGALQRRLAVQLVRLSANQIMLTGIGIILFGYFFRSLIPEIWYFLVILGLILFFTAFGLSFLGGGRAARRGQIYWRGRPSSYYEGGPPAWNRLREWWQRRQGRR